MWMVAQTKVRQEKKAENNLKNQGAHITDNYIIIKVDKISLEKEDFGARGNLFQKGYNWMGEFGITIDLNGVMLRK